MGIEATELREFKEVVVPDCPSVREVINQGQRSFDEFLSLLEKSQRLREWIQSVNPDASLVRDYLKQVTAQG
jgi:hypothetical protein